MNRGRRTGLTMPWRRRSTRPSGPEPDHAAVEDADLAGQAPPGSDWIWRPGAFRAPLAVPRPVGHGEGQSLGDGLAVFHDCPVRDLTLRQLPRDAGPGTPPHVFAIDVGNFSGTYLSIVIDLPAPAASALTRRDIVSLQPTLRLSEPVEVFVRFNLRHGPNTDALTRKAPERIEDTRIDFDLAALAVDPDRVEGAWIDLILSRPQALRIDLHDLVLSRRLRAQL